MTGLIIEMSPVLREIERRVLEGLGAGSVAETSRPTEGIAQAAQTHPNVVVVGWLRETAPELPGGPEIVRALRSRGVASAIVVVGSEAHRPRLAEAIEAGANACVFKPFSPDLLSQRIAEALRASG